jgi:predicted ATPase
MTDPGRVRRIAVTGGPGAGKTTLWRAIIAEHGDRIVAVPEVATLMLRHVFPPVQSERERRAVQRSIFRVQHDLEAVHEVQLQPGQVLLCDRGTPDGGGYWPEGHEAFSAAMLTTCEAELARYEAVLFLETAAAGDLAIADNNDTRTEDRDAAVAIDRRLHAVWSRHPRFHHVACAAVFEDKLRNALSIIRTLL